MTVLVPALVIALILLALIGYVFSKMETHKATQMLRVGLGIGAIILGGLMTIRGAVMFGGPIIVAGFGFLGTALRGGKKPNTNTSPSTQMTPSEAARILGVKDTASRDEIHQAYRAMMKKVHPDKGGSDVLAAQVQQAFEILSRDSKKKT